VCVCVCGIIMIVYCRTPPTTGTRPIPCRIVALTPPSPQSLSRSESPIRIDARLESLSDSAGIKVVMRVSFGSSNGFSVVNLRACSHCCHEERHGIE